MDWLARGEWGLRRDELYYMITCGWMDPRSRTAKWTSLCITNSSLWSVVKLVLDPERGPIDRRVTITTGPEPADLSPRKLNLKSRS